MFLLLTTYLLLFVYLFSKLSVSSFLSGACSPRREGKACSRYPSAAKALVQAVLSKTTEKKPGGSHPPKNKH